MQGCIHPSLAGPGSFPRAQETGRGAPRCEGAHDGGAVCCCSSPVCGGLVLSGIMEDMTPLSHCSVADF